MKENQYRKNNNLFQAQSSCFQNFYLQQSFDCLPCTTYIIHLLKLGRNGNRKMLWKIVNKYSKGTWKEKKNKQKNSLIFPILSGFSFNFQWLFQVFPYHYEPWVLYLIFSSDQTLVFDFKLHNINSILYGSRLILRHPNLTNFRPMLHFYAPENVFRGYKNRILA